MTNLAILGISVLMSFLAFGIVTRLYIWPWLQTLPRVDALRALVVPHTFRFIGLSFLVPGVVSPSLPAAFANPAAYGDQIAAVLAMIAVWAISMRATWAIAVTWVFNVWGTADLLHAISQRIDPGALGAAFYIPTVIVPFLLITHALIFWLLLRPQHATRS